MLEYDCILVNGDSYSALNADMKVYSRFLEEKLNVPVINVAVAGSNNDRITRTTIEHVIKLTQEKKRILVLIGWSFIRRLEVWYYGNNPLVEHRIPDKQYVERHQEPRFVTLDVLANLGQATVEQKCLINEDLFVHKQLADFYTNVYLLSQFLQNKDVDYFFFSAAKNVEIPVHSFPALENLQQVQQVMADKRIYQLHNFYIQGWAHNNDSDAHSVTGHLSSQGHDKFANFLLEKIKNDIQSHQTT